MSFEANETKQHIAWIGTTTRALRLQRGRSQTDLAVRAGLSRQLLSLIENGNGNCTLDTLVRLFSAFDKRLVIRLEKKPNAPKL